MNLSAPLSDSAAALRRAASGSARLHGLALAVIAALACVGCQEARPPAAPPPACGPDGFGPLAKHLKVGVQVFAGTDHRRFGRIVKLDQPQPGTTGSPERGAVIETGKGRTTWLPNDVLRSHGWSVRCPPPQPPPAS